VLAAAVCSGVLAAGVVGGIVWVQKRAERQGAIRRQAEEERKRREEIETTLPP